VSGDPRRLAEDLLARLRSAVGEHCTIDRESHIDHVLHLLEHAPLKVRPAGAAALPLPAAAPGSLATELGA
jgi:hypothetical protein